MNDQSNERALKLILQPILDTYHLEEINTKGIVQTIRSVLGNRYISRMLYVLSSIPSTDRRVLEENMLESYREELEEKLPGSCLLVNRNGELQLVRRPEVLSTYEYMDKVFLAISERQLITGDNGIIATAEIADFQTIPSPAEDLSTKEVSEAWKTDLKTIDAFLTTNFLTKPHQVQVDVFLENRMNLLVYDRQGTFVEALPKAAAKDAIQIFKGRKS